MNTNSITCKSCSNVFTGKFCNNCGEKLYNDHDKSLKHLFDDVFHFFTHFDNKFLKTVKLVLFKPGYLSSQYCEGIRKPYFKPVSLFIICVILYLLFPFFSGLNMQFGTYHSSNYTYAPFVQPAIQQKLQNNAISIDQLATRYNQASPKFAKVMILLYLPLSALALSILFSRRKKYYFDHFILSTELNSFYILIGFLVVPIFAYAMISVWPASERFFKDGSVFFKMVLGLYLVVFAVALRRFYKERWIWIVIKAIIFLLLFMFVIRFLYNLLLFYLVMLFI